MCATSPERIAARALGVNRIGMVGIMTLLAGVDPDFIDRNRGAQAPTGLTLAESARDFYENQGAELTDEYVPWLANIMPPSN